MAFALMLAPTPPPKDNSPVKLPGSLVLLIAVFSLVPVAFAQDEPPLPQPRPQGIGEAQPEEENQALSEEEEDEASEPRPGDDEPAPDQEEVEERIYQAACPALLTGRIVGEMVPPLSQGTCGLQSPIAVSALMINGRQVMLSETLTTNCSMATAFAEWAEEVDAYAGATLDTHVETLATGPGYVCRLRNNADTGFVSEHGLGNAIDIASVGLADGTTISVLEDWDLSEDEPGPARFLDFAHSAACGRFTTVLGPEANADHEDHLHFDLGCHGQSCTAQICE